MMFNGRKSFTKSTTIEEVNIGLLISCKQNKVISV